MSHDAAVVRCHRCPDGCQGLVLREGNGGRGCNGGICCCVSSGRGARVLPGWLRGQIRYAQQPNLAMQETLRRLLIRAHDNVGVQDRFRALVLPMREGLTNICQLLNGAHKLCREVLQAAWCALRVNVCSAPTLTEGVDTKAR